MIDPRLVEWLKARQEWHHVLLDQRAVKEIIQFLEDVATQYPEQPDYWTTCGQCQKNIDRAEDLIEIVYKEHTNVHT